MEELEAEYRHGLSEAERHLASLRDASDASVAAALAEEMQPFVRKWMAVVEPGLRVGAFLEREAARRRARVAELESQPPSEERDEELRRARERLERLNRAGDR